MQVLRITASHPDAYSTTTTMHSHTPPGSAHLTPRVQTPRKELKKKEKREGWTERTERRGGKTQQERGNLTSKPLNLLHSS
jgi:hypothetical protein